MYDRVTVHYKGDEYDITDYLPEHPGGRQVIQNYIQHGKNITQVFKSLHSQEAEKKLLGVRVLRKVERSRNEKIYIKIEERVSRLYQCSYPYELFFYIAILSTFLASIWFTFPLLVILSFAFSQILGAWVAHSALHSQGWFLRMSGKVMGGVILGLSCEWWKKKHSNHHIFTNCDNLDGDINLYYRTVLFPLLLVKWRLQSIWFSLKKLNITQLLLLTLHYYLLSKQKGHYFLVGAFIAGFYISLIVFGNHEREKKYKAGNLDTYLEHQLGTTTNYDWDYDSLHLIMGGFQYHVEHHLFPQIPFYKLHQAKKIVNQQLQIYKKQIRISRMV